ncbi:MAG: SIS domain-containing protein [Sedimentisphaerales bacterium]|nr:SIS domain-containing protein [Sedimentisphaerales bacterium]
MADRKDGFDVEDSAAIRDLVEQMRQRHPALGDARQDLLDCFRAIVETFGRGGILYLCGNGGSFADALHIKGELAKSFERPRPPADAAVCGRLQASETGRLLCRHLQGGLPVLVLGESHSLRSAFANDCDPELVYAQELNGFAPLPIPGVLLAISTSGNARNVLAAVTLARAYGLRSIGLTGPDGGRLAEAAEIVVRAPGECTAEIQENQVVLYHTLCRLIEYRLYKDKT